jgi:PAS domain S-box-containing protein
MNSGDAREPSVHHSSYDRFLVTIANELIGLTAQSARDVVRKILQRAQVQFSVNSVHMWPADSRTDWDLANDGTAADLPEIATCLDRTNRTVIADTGRLPRADRETFRRLGIGSALIVSIDANDHRCGILILGCRETGSHWSDEQTACADQLATMLGRALEQLHLSQDGYDVCCEYKKFFDSAREGIWVIDPDNRTSKVNARMAEMLGYSVDEMTGRSLFDFMDEQGRTQCEQNLQRRRSGIAEQHEFEFITKQGRRIHCTLEASPLFDRNGNYQGAVAGVIDVTERRRAEIEARRWQDRLREAQRIARLGYWEYRSSDRTFTWSPELCHILEIDPEECDAYADFALELIHPDDRQKAREEAAQLVDTGETVSLDLRVVTRQGSQKIVHVIAWSVRSSSSGSSIFRGVAQDVSARRRVERDLDESRDRLVRIATQIPGMVFQFRIDGDGNWSFPYINEESEMYYGYKAGDMMRNPHLALELVHPDDRDEARKHLSQSLEELSPYAMTHRVIRDDGQVRWMAVRSVPARDDDGATTWTGVTIDITDRVEAERARADAEEFLQSVLNGLSATIAIVDEQGRIVHVNQAWREFALDNGAKPDDVGEGASYVQACENATPENRQEARQFLAGLRRVLTKEQAEYIQEYSCHSPSERRWFIVRVTAFPGEGPPLAIVAHENITKRKLAELQVQESQERYAITMNAIEEGLYDWDLRTDTVHFSDSYCRLLGYEPGELAETFETYQQLLHPDDFGRSNQAIADYLRSDGNPKGIDLRLRMKSGEYVWIHCSGKVVEYDQHGKPARMVGTLVNVDARKRAEQALERSEARFRSLFENSPDIVGLIDCDGTIEDINRLLHGCRREDVIGRPWTDVFTDDQPSVFWEAAHRAEGTGEPQEYEVVTQAPDGRVVVWNCRVAPIHAEPSRLQFVVSCTDITDRRLAEEQLKESEAQLNMIIENMPVMVDAFDDNLTIVFWNKECERVTGYTEQEIVGNPEAMKLLYPDPELFEKVMQMTPQGIGDFRGMELPISCKDGSERTIAWYSISESCPIPGWSYWAVGVDLTDQKEAETALRLSEERFRSVFEQAAVGLTQIRLDGRIQVANTRYCEMTGYTADELVGKSFLEITHPEDRPDSSEMFNHLLRSSGANYCREKRCLRKDGSVIWVRVSVSLIRDVHASPKYTMSVVEDITERRQMEQSLKESEDKFRRLVSAMTDAVVILDGQTWVVTDLNKAAEAFSGLEGGQTAQRTIDELITDPTAARELMDVLQDQGKVWGHRVNILRSDREPFVAEVSASSFESRGKKLACLVIRDITERLEVERRLQEINQELLVNQKALEQKNSALSEVLSQIEQEKRIIVNQMTTNIKRVILPVVNKLAQLLGNKEQEYIRRLRLGLDEIASPFVSRLEKQFAALTPRELEVASMIKEGMTSKEIASFLNTSVETVRNHRKSIRRKLGLTHEKANLASFLRTM